MSEEEEIYLKNLYVAWTKYNNAKEPIWEDYQNKRYLIDLVYTKAVKRIQNAAVKPYFKRLYKFYNGRKIPDAFDGLDEAFLKKEKIYRKAIEKKILPFVKIERRAMLRLDKAYAEAVAPLEKAYAEAVAPLEKAYAEANGEKK